MWKKGSKQRLFSQSECRFYLYSGTLISGHLLRSCWSYLTLDVTQARVWEAFAAQYSQASLVPLSEESFLKVTGQNEESTVEIMEAVTFKSYRGDRINRKS